MLNNKMIHGFLILFVGLAMSFNMANAQVTGEEQAQNQNKFSGQVVDASTGQALADVTVKVKGQDQEATTDQEGKFTFENLNLDSQSGYDAQNEEGGEMANLGITIEINHEGYEPFSETIRPEDIRSQNQPQDMGDQGQMSNLMTFELEPKVSS